MDAQAWNERYATAELVWSESPNVFVAEVTGALPPGRALDLACGEGRNAIWLARRGWTVTGVDFSDAAIAKARHLAEKAQVSVDWMSENVIDWEPATRSFDLVVVCYLHLPHEAMSRVLGHARRALAESGSLFVVGHARANLADGIGGPQDPGVLYEPEDVTGWLGDLEVVRAEHVNRVVETPDGSHTAIDTLVLAHRAGG
jgi:2-polyprenyl-3-methyl-5-hydroxy-6-metoxy-1,4-benzoquinol methylase